MRIVRRGVLVSLLMVYAPMAMAQGKASVSGRVDRVELDDGTEARGTITEIVPLDHVTLRGADGSVTTIGWSRVRRIERDVAAPADASTTTSPPAAASGSSAPPAPPPGMKVVPAVRVHIDGNRAAVLERRTSEEYEWVTACVSPCDVNVPVGDQYRISGDGVRPSSSFFLKASAGEHVRLRVSTSSSTASGWGKALLIGGGVITLLGLASSDSSSGSPRGPVIAVGVIAGAVGAVLVLANLDTTYSQSTEARVPVARTRLELPAWRVDPDAPKSSILDVPILRGTF